MNPFPALTLVLSLQFLAIAAAQQIPDLEYNPPIPEPAYPPNKGPRVSIDEAHHNFHTAVGRYQPFAQLLRRDGYIIDRHRKKISSTSLEKVDVLVIANPIHKQNDGDWSLPTPSAYTLKEIEAIHSWVEDGGSLLLIADHMPFPGGAGDLAQSFGITFSNGFAYLADYARGKPDLFQLKSGLEESVVTKGRNPKERVSKIASFTGSAFKAPASAIPIMVFGPGSHSLEPTKAWDFNETTARVPIDDWCQSAIMAVGKGRIAVFGEAAMFTAQRAGPTKRPMGMSRPEASQNHQLLLNVMHWLSGLL